jgi:hypothetical protein
MVPGNGPAASGAEGGEVDLATQPAAASRDDLERRLAELGIATSSVEHPPVFTVEDARALRGEIAGGHCKNLFLKDKKGQVWLVVCLEETDVDLKLLPAKIGSARLSFGRPELLRRAARRRARIGHAVRPDQRHRPAGQRRPRGGDDAPRDAELPSAGQLRDHEHCRLRPDDVHPRLRP